MRGERAGNDEWHWSGERHREGRTDTGKGDMGRFGYGRDFVYEYCISRIGFALALDTTSRCMAV